MGKDKLDQIKTGVGQDQDAGALAQAKPLGAQYIVTGNVIESQRRNKTFRSPHWELPILPLPNHVI